MQRTQGVQKRTGTDTLIITEGLSKIVSKAQEHVNVAI